MAKTSCKKGQYYCNTDKKCKPIPDGYKVREDGFLVSEGSNPRIPRKAGQPAKSKKHSDLYTDEDPKGTIHGLGFKDVATAKASVAKIRKSSRSHAHKIQAAIAMEQRARVMGKSSEAAIYRKFINSMKKKTKKMNEAVSPAQQAAIAIDMKKKGKKPKSMNEGSLHKWFKGSKSKDGKGGWVNVVTGGTCASDEPGEGTPKCVSSAKRASMTKAERLSAARRKKKADPGQQQKTGAAKPTYVSTDKPKKKKKMKKESTEFTSLPLVLEVPQSDGEFKCGLMFRESLEQDRGMLFIFESNDYWTFHMKNTFIPLDIAFIKEDGTIDSIKELDPMNPVPVYPDSEIRYAVEVNRGWFAENNVEVGDKILEEAEEINEVKDKKGKGSGTKDACYYKVKSRYSVWPSAYASGALVKCRKVGAANWGNSKKEEVEYEYEVPTGGHYSWRDSLNENDELDEQLLGAIKKVGSAVGSAVGGAVQKVGSALKTKPIQRKPGQTSVRTRGGGAPQAAPQVKQAAPKASPQVKQAAPAQQAQQTSAAPVQKMGRTEVANRERLGNAKVDALKAKNQEFQAAKKSGNLAQYKKDNPKLSGKQRAQAMAKARIAARNTVPSGSMNISAKGKEQAAANRAEVARKNNQSGGGAAAGTPVRKVTSSTTQSGNTTSTQTNVKSGVTGGTTKDLTSSAGSLQKNKAKAKQLANNANKNAAMSGSGATTTVGKIDDF